MEANKNNSQSLVFDIRVRISDPSNNYYKSSEIANKIKDLILENESFIEDAYHKKYKEDFQRISDKYHEQDDVNRSRYRLINDKEKHYSVLSSYIKWRINNYCSEFRSDYNLEEKQLKVNVRDINFDNGSLIITFNLVINTLINIYTLYSFVRNVVNYLSDDKSLSNNGRLITSITACPAVSLIEQNTLISNKINKTKLFSFLISIALALSVTACILAAIGYFNQYDDKDLDAKVKEQAEQVISKEVPKMIQDAIDKEKLDYLYINQVLVQKQTNPAIGSSKTKENGSISK